MKRAALPTPSAPPEEPIRPAAVLSRQPEGEALAVEEGLRVGLLDRVAEGLTEALEPGEGLALALALGQMMSLMMLVVTSLT